VRVTQEVQANEIFAVLPAHVIEPLRAAYPFYVWDEKKSEVRLVASFDTTEGDVDGFLGELGRLLG
jgi:threonine aldolase